MEEYPVIMTFIGGLIGSAFTFFGVFLASNIEKRKMQVKVIVERRKESLEERRQTLKELCYYTDFKLIERLSRDAYEEHIRKLIEIKSRFEYRLIDVIYPGSDLQESVIKLIDDTIDLMSGENCSAMGNYNNDRKRCLQMIKIYNYATWEFLQWQSSGISRKGLKMFYKSYFKTLLSIKEIQNDEKDNYLIRLNKNVISRGDETNG